ncbi:MAG: acylphosphatase [Phycisphaerales bacterium]|nr:acylphosphatase [Phycisphaerales bacterium]
MNERRRVSYRGNVQGVGFRATAKGVARGWPVSGWVRNEADGTVTLEVQGEGSAVDGMLGDLRRRMAGHIRQETSMTIGVKEGEEEFRIER